MRFHSVPCDEQVESFRGECQILRKHGLSVISDIDDTIKDTNLANPKVNSPSELTQYSLPSLSHQLYPFCGRLPLNSDDLRFAWNEHF